LDGLKKSKAKDSKSRRAEKAAGIFHFQYRERGGESQFHYPTIIIVGVNHG